MENRTRSILVRTVLVLVNTGVYIYALFLITFLGGAMWNGLLIPDRCTPINVSRECDIIGRLALWGGAFVEAIIFCFLIFLLNKAILRSFLIPVRTSKAILWAELVLALILYSWIGIHV